MNLVVHSNVGGSLSAKQHDILVEKVEQLLQTNPHTLLPEHRALLEMNFEKIGSGSVIDLRSYGLLRWMQRLGQLFIFENGRCRPCVRGIVLVHMHGHQ